MENYIPAKTLAARLAVGENTLAKWRVRGAGPAHIRAGRRILYAEADVTAWLDSCRAQSTSEANGNG